MTSCRNYVCRPNTQRPESCELSSFDADRNDQTLLLIEAHLNMILFGCSVEFFVATVIVSPASSSMLLSRTPLCEALWFHICSHASDSFLSWILPWKACNGMVLSNWAAFEGRPSSLSLLTAPWTCSSFSISGP